MNIEIKPYSDEFVKMHEEFALKVWPQKRRRGVEKYIRWKFRGPETGDVNGFLLAIGDNKVIGQFGLIPVRLRFKENIYDAQWACDLMVDPDLRKSGIGGKLSKESIKRDIVTLGNNPSPNAEKTLISAGFRHMQSGRLMVFPLNVNHIMKWVIPGKFNFAIPALSKFIQPYFNSKLKNVTRSESDFENCDWRDIINLIANKENECDKYQIVHDSEFMKWRADGLDKYTSKISGAKNNKGSYFLHSDFSPYYQIYEWYCKDIGEVRNMLSFIFEIAIKHKMELVQTIANSEKEEKWLASFGFIRARSYEKIVVYSKLFTFENTDQFYFSLYDTDNNL